MKKRILILFTIFLCASILIFLFWRKCKIFLMVLLLSLQSNEIIWVDFGNGYKYLNEYALLDQTGYPGDGVFWETIPFILPKIEVYKFDKNYITIKQKYSKQNSSKLLREVLYTEYWGRINTDVFPVYDSIMYDTFKKYYEIERTSIRVQVFCDSVVDNNPYFKIMEKNDYNYYIIEKYGVVKYGPLSRNEFEDKFISFRLTPNLWINE